MIYHQRYNSRGNYNYNAYTYKNRDWAPHFHKNFELIYIKEGGLYLTVNGITETMRQGDYAIILPNQIHSFDPTEHSVIWVAIFSSQFVPQFAAGIEKLEGEHSVFRCSESIDLLLKSNLIDRESTITMKKACFYAVCDEYRRAVPMHERKAGNDELIFRIFDYIEKHYTEDISLSGLAEEFGYEYHYISRILNQGYRIRFSELVNEYRVNKAIELLSNKELSITDIALESGFRSIRNFNHVFKQITGVPPGSYTDT